MTVICQDAIIANVITNSFYTYSKTEEELLTSYVSMSPKHLIQQIVGKSESSNCLNFHDDANVFGLNWSPKTDESRLPNGIKFALKVIKRCVAYMW